MKFLRQLSDYTNKVTQITAIILLLIMLSLSLAAILSQFILNEPIAWGYSLTRLFLPWVALLSITVTLKANEHIGINFFLRMLPPGFAQIANRINLIVIAFFGLALVWFGTGFFLNSTQMFMVSDTLQLSHKWTAITVPLTGLIITIHVLGGLSPMQTDDPVDSFDPDKGETP
jgi:TRAP-type C4-dicarboxylate transport system permease small subunit